MNVEGHGLTEKQGALVARYLETDSIGASWQAAGYADITGAQAAMRSPRVQSALKAARLATINGDAAGEAVTTMRELMKPGIPPAVRLGAAKWVLEAAGLGAKDRADDRETPVHEMTPAQLHAFIAKAQLVVDAGGEPPLIVVVPEDGALPDLSA